jgi:cell division transport system ATP-binding protein
VGVTVLIATHDIALVERMNKRRLILQDGQMIAGQNITSGVAHV